MRRDVPATIESRMPLPPDHSSQRPPRDWRDHIERRQGWLFAPLLLGLILWPFLGMRVGLSVSGAAVVAAGCVPILTGRYITPLIRLRGTAARIRGLISVAVGAGVIALAWGFGG